MTLEDLRTAMVAAATGTDIQEVYFDYNKAASSTLVKQYPLVLWDIVNLDGEKPIRAIKTKAPTDFDVWVAGSYTPDDDKIPDWDSLMADLDEYLISLNESEFVTVNLESVKWTLFDSGLFSVDREMAVKYRVTVTAWC